MSATTRCARAATATAVAEITGCARRQASGATMRSPLTMEFSVYPVISTSCTTQSSRAASTEAGASTRNGRARSQAYPACAGVRRAGSMTRG
ncbi:MAG: hypothetical protein ACFCUP_12070 [Actinomycetales bacterium]